MRRTKNPSATFAARKPCFCAVVFVCGLIAISVAASQGTESESRRPPEQRHSRVALVKKLAIADYGISKCSDMRLGDLDGDNQLDMLLVQNQGQSIASLTAIDITGRKLWETGKPDAGDCKKKFDVPVQIYDIDQDGVNEVICVMGDKLTILSGRDGAVEKELPLPAKDARDCIAFANFSGNAQPRELVLKSRHKKVWVFDKNFEVMWGYTGETGHYTWPHDFDGDGRDDYVQLRHVVRKSVRRWQPSWVWCSA